MSRMREPTRNPRREEKQKPAPVEVPETRAVHLLTHRLRPMMTMGVDAA